jgi:hypothetical protein
VAGVIQQPLMEVAQVLGSTRDDNGPTVPAPKMDEVVCAHNFLRRKGTKPILQATVYFFFSPFFVLYQLKTM